MESDLDAAQGFSGLGADIINRSRARCPGYGDV
jgi:hypothetical protein